MTYIQGSTFSITSDASSAASTYSPETYNGLLHSIAYIPSGSSALSTAMGATFSGELSGQKFLVISPLNSTVDAYYQPRVSIHTTAGATAAGADLFALVNERLKVDVSSGGVGKIGTFRVVVR